MNILTRNLARNFAFSLYLAIFFFPLVSFASEGEGSRLQRSMIWHPVDSSKAVVFKKSFRYESGGPAILTIFADSRYMLYINGVYVMRGPCRFDPKQPEYDSMQVGKFLHKGLNSIAVLVYGHISSGESMEHAPGLGLHLFSGNWSVLTDASWKCSNQTRFRRPTVRWDGIRENVNAMNEKTDWLDPSSRGAEWLNAVNKDPKLWGAFVQRTTPMIASKEIPFYIQGKKFPFEVKGPAEIHLKLEKNIMGFCVLQFDADAGSRIRIFDHEYTARQGSQEYITADVYGSGLTDTFGSEVQDNPDSVLIPLYVQSGRVRFTKIRICSFIAPLVQVGSFSSSDTMLTRFWQVIANMHTQTVQDTYTDGASEGNEWVADVHNISQFTKVAFVGRDKNQKLMYKENLYIRKALSDFALSQQPNGRIKAHHPSDRFDLHWYIEDFACTWVNDILAYYRLSHDKKYVQKLWPSVQKQMALFQDSVTTKGLVYGREWCIFDNPYAYKHGEGATLNAFVYKAFLSAADLAELSGSEKEAVQYRASAARIKKAFNEYFWNEQQGSFRGMIDSALTTHAAVMSLFTGICSEAHKSRVQAWLFKRKQDSIIYPVLHQFWFKCLYEMNTDEADQQVLDIIHQKYANRWNAYNKGYLTAESCDGGRNFHNFGMVPGYFLSAYILGVREMPSAENKGAAILIEPRLGDLESASGTVLTPYGLVSVSWKREKDHSLKFSYSIPKGLKARIAIPRTAAQKSLKLDAKMVMEKGKTIKNMTLADRFVYFNSASAGHHSGRIY